MTDRRQEFFEKSQLIPLTGLVRVFASGLSCVVADDIRLIILSIEVYREGFIVRYQLESDRLERRVILPDLSVWDDAGTEYWVMPGAVDTAPGISRGEVRVVPSPNPSARTISFAVATLTSFVPGSPDTPRLLRPARRPEDAGQCQVKLDVVV
jgi:hypothetical protein